MSHFSFRKRTHMPGLMSLPVADGEVKDLLGVHHVSGAVMLVARIHHAGPMSLQTTTSFGSW